METGRSMPFYVVDANQIVKIIPFSKNLISLYHLEICKWSQ